MLSVHRMFTGGGAMCRDLPICVCMPVCVCTWVYMYAYSASVALCWYQGAWMDAMLAEEDVPQ